MHTMSGKLIVGINSNLHLSDNGDPAPLFTALQYRSFAGTRSASGSRVIIGIGYLYSTC